jgi:hypothetical protein
VNELQFLFFSLSAVDHVMIWHIKLPNHNRDVYLIFYTFPYSEFAPELWWTLVEAWGRLQFAMLHYSHSHALFIILYRCIFNFNRGRWFWFLVTARAFSKVHTYIQNTIGRPGLHN